MSTVVHDETLGKGSNLEQRDDSEMNRRGSWFWAIIVLLLFTAATLGCAEHPSANSPDPDPPTARPELLEHLEKDLTSVRHPADGAGTVFINEGTDGVASTTGRWIFTFTAGPEGIVEGGMLFLQVSPFWGWSTPQVVDRDAPGFTEVSTSADGITLEPQTLGPELLGIQIKGRKLLAGEVVNVVYGAGPRGAVADRYAERRSRFWFAVDGDGDGIRAVISASPTIDIAPGPPARLQIVLPSTARTGDTIRLTVAVLDAVGNTGVKVSGDVVFTDPPDGLDLPKRITLSPADAGRKSVTLAVTAPATYTLTATGPAGLSGQSNPLDVSSHGPRILWGDLHGHSNLSDGTGTPADYFRYARDVASLDVVALTDHDHWGMQFLDTHPELWAEIKRQTKHFHNPHRFVTLLGYEWTSWIHGHRHVLYFSDDGDLHSSLSPDVKTPTQLWAKLRGQQALTFAHHSAGGPIATNWSYPPDPILEPVTEIASVHGSSEAADSPSRIYNPVPGNFVRDVLAKGYRLGFVGSGDSHDGHPGNAHMAAASGGLAAILSEDVTRAAILAALRARRVYATNGPRIILRVALDGSKMGGVYQIKDGTDPELAVRVVGTAVVEAVDVIHSGTVVSRISGGGSSELAFAQPLEQPRAGGYVYVRVIQAGGGLAWSSPIFLE